MLHWTSDPTPTLRTYSEVAQSCPTLCDPVDCSLPGSSVHGILQARVLGWVAISFSRGSSQPRDWTWVSCIAGRCFILWATREALLGKYQNHRSQNFFNIYFSYRKNCRAALRYIYIYIHLSYLHIIPYKYVNYKT